MNKFKFGVQKLKMEPKWEPNLQNGAKRDQNGAKGFQKGPKWSQKGPKWSQKESKGYQKGAKWRPKCIRKPMPEKGSEKGAKKVSASYTFGSALGSFLVQKPEKTPSENHLKIDAEKVEKIM